MLTGERRDVVPIGDELRALAWLGVMLIATGVGIVVKKHLDQIGPLAIAIVIGAAAVFCYVWPALNKRAPLDDYVRAPVSKMSESMTWSNGHGTNHLAIDILRSGDRIGGRPAADGDAKIRTGDAARRRLVEVRNAGRFSKPAVDRD